jgi:hypothetical protein
LPWGNGSRICTVDHHDLGHTTTQLFFSNYREFVQPESAERYFQIYAAMGREHRPAGFVRGVVMVDGGKQATGHRATGHSQRPPR